MARVRVCRISVKNIVAAILMGSRRAVAQRPSAERVSDRDQDEGPHDDARTCGKSNSAAVGNACVPSKANNVRT